jgi:sortase A
VAYPLWWDHRSNSGGQALLHQAAQREGLAPGDNPGGSSSGGRAPASLSACTATTTPGGGPQLPAILEVPSIGLEAPVLQGLTDAVLGDSVGHDPTSPWPGGQGVSLLLAHDASFFSHLGGVRPGDEVAWIDDCQKLLFRVTSSYVTQPGTTIAPPPGGVGLALITCSPSDALFWTPDRLVVTARLVSVGATTLTHVTPPSPLGVSLPAPPDLVGQGLGLAQNQLLVGNLSTRGTPDRAWLQGPDPLRAAQLAFEDLAALKLTVAAQDSRWWSAISVPGVVIPASLSTSGEFDAVLTVRGTSVVSVTLASPWQTVQLVVQHHKLLVASVSG